MALVTWNSNMPKLWRRLYQKRVLQSVRPRKQSSNVFRFRTKGKELASHKPFHEHPIVGPYDETPWLYTAASASAPVTLSITRGASFKEMGLGKGGRIAQKVYPDKFCRDGEPSTVWEDKPEATMAIYLVDAESFEKITGLKAPPLLPTFKKYAGPYFKLPDEAMPDTEGSEVFAGLKSVFVEE